MKAKHIHNMVIGLVNKYGNEIVLSVAEERVEKYE